MDGKTGENSSSNDTLFNKLDAKLDNNLQLNTNASYRELTAFLRDYKSQKTEDSNIIDQGQQRFARILDRLNHLTLIVIQRAPLH